MKINFFNADRLINYNFYISSINNIKNFFIKEKQKLTKRFKCFESESCQVNNFIKYRNSYRKLVKKSILKTVDVFSQFLKNKKYTVMLCGSYARSSDRDFSDIDLTLIYDYDKNEMFIIFEELLYYALAFILDISRDKIHSIFCYTIPETQHYNLPTGIKINWESKDVVSYNFRKNTELDMHLFRAGPRKYSVFLNYISKNIKKNPELEWLYSFHVLRDRNNYNITKTILSLEKTISSNLTNLKQNINIKYKYEKNYDLTLITSRELKKLIKYNFLDDFYNFVSKVRHRLVLNDKYNKFLNIKDFLNIKCFYDCVGKVNIGKIKQIYYNYMWLLTKFEYLLAKKQIELSSHSDIQINCKNISDEFKRNNNFDKNVISELIRLNNEAKKIFNKIIEGL